MVCDRPLNMIIKRSILAAVAAMALPCLALAQSNPNLQLKQVPTPAQWNSYFAAKQDVLGYQPINKAGDVMLGRLVTPAPSATTSGFNLSPGTLPGSPTNGDLWVTSGGLFAQVNGITIGPLSGATSASFAGTSPVTVSFPSGVVTYACATCAVIGNPLSQFASTTSAQLRGIISDETGTGSAVFGTGPTLVAPVLGTPASATLTNAIGLPISTGLAGAGTGVLAALGNNLNASGGMVGFSGALGTPTSGTLTNATGLPVSTGISGLGTGVAAALGINVGTAGSVVINGGALGTPSSGTLTSATGLPISTGVSGLGTGAAAALAANIGTAGSFVVNGGALGSPSSAGTLPAHTLGGTVSGGGNQVNNVIIGSVTPLAGTFTTLGSGAHTVTSASANALSVGLNGATNPALNVDDSTASQVAGINIKGAVTGGNVTISTTDSGANNNLLIDAKGTGDVIIGANSGPTIFGPGGSTASITGKIILNGSSGGNGGAVMQFQRGGVNLFSFGNSSAILGGASNDFLVYSVTSGAGASPSIAVADATGAMTVQTNFGTTAPVTTTINRTMLFTDNSVIFNGAGSLTYTMQAAATYPGRWLYVKTIAAQTVVSASSNVVPLAGGAAATAILAATAGKWAALQSDGANWIIMASN